MRRPNPHRIKIHRNYTVDDAARALGVHRQTILRWIRSGKLPALRDQRPMLILGADLVDYLKSRAKPKHTYLPHEFLCFTCKIPRGPAFGDIEYIPFTPHSGNLRALCEECGTLMHKGISAPDLEALSRDWAVTIVQASPHLVDSPAPSSNDHLRKEPETYAKTSSK